jgi:hypothetical protein
MTILTSILQALLLVFAFCLFIRMICIQVDVCIALEIYGRMNRREANLIALGFTVKNLFKFRKYEKSAKSLFLSGFSMSWKDIDNMKNAYLR